jgi:hypothetical protein
MRQNTVMGRKAQADRNFATKRHKEAQKSEE